MNYRSPRPPYRGYGQSKRRKRGILFAVLFGVCLLAGSAFLLLQDYLVFSADGVRLELPFFRAKGSTDTNSDDNEFPPIEIDSSESETDQPVPVNEESEQQPNTIPRIILNAVYADYKRLSDQDYRKSLLSLPGVNAVVIDLKLPDGQVTYRSKSAVEGAQTKATDAISEAIREFSDNGIYVIGRMSVFRDNVAPRTAMRASALQTENGAAWLDYKMIGWFDPYKDESAEYIAALAKEASAIGIDELLLYNLCFPVEGKTGLISYSDAGGKDKDAAILDALRTIDAALEETTMVLSVMAEDKALLTGADENSGQNLSELSETGRVYFNGSDHLDFIDAGKWDGISPGAFEQGKIVPVIQAKINDKPLAGISKDILLKCGFVLINENGEYTAVNFSE